MPWKESTVLDQRMKFIVQVQAQEIPFAQICAEAGISRPTGYTWLHRYEAEGPKGLHDRSRAPHHSPQAISPEIETEILAIKAKYSTWGASKILDALLRKAPTQSWPAVSTISAMLDRHGLVAHRPRCQRAIATPSETLTVPTAPHDVWALDFKGWFHLGDGKCCYPFTLTDSTSRYLLRCQALDTADGAHVRPLLEAAFREYGLPSVIRSDNGTPFASVGLGGLSRLAVWWLKLGIKPERIPPGCPWYNGRHERMHRTLQEDVTKKPSANMRAQQRAFDSFRQVYNNERPHQALNGQVPADIFNTSARPYPARLPAFTYPDDVTVRLVRQNGCLKWQGRDLFISEVLIGEPVGLRQLTTRHWVILLGNYRLAVLDTETCQWASRKEARQLLLLCEEEPLFS